MLATIKFSYKVQIVVLFWAHGCGQGGSAERTNGPGGEAGALIGIVQVVGIVQIAAAQVAVKVGAKPVDHRGVGLKQHALVDAVLVHARHAGAFGVDARFFFHNRRKDNPGFELGSLCWPRLFAIGPHIGCLAPEVVHHAPGNGPGLCQINNLILFEQIGVWHQKSLCGGKGYAVVAQKVRVGHNLAKIFKNNKPGFFKNLACLPPCKALWHGNAVEYRVPVDQFVQHLFRQPAGIERKAASLKAVFPLFIAGQQVKLAGVRNHAQLDEPRTHLRQPRPGGNIIKNLAARGFGRGVQEGVRLVGHPTPTCQGQQQQQPKRAQQNLHAGLRSCGASERKEERMRTAACWSSTALRLRTLRPASRRSDHAS